jgi:5-methylcytosine-specific restriction endonuclease McrA
MKRLYHTIMFQITGHPRYKQLARGKTQVQINRQYVRSAVTGKLRYQVMRRDNFTCQLCGTHGTEKPLHVDHILPVALGGKSNLANLQTLCMECNLGKGKDA